MKEVAGPHNKPYVILLDVESIDKTTLCEALENMGFKVGCWKWSELADWPLSIEPQLVVVDVKRHGSEVVTKAKCLDTASSASVLAIVDVADPHKDAVFQLGAYDYISSPLILSELHNRLPDILVSLSVASSTSVTPSYQLAAKAGKYLQTQLANEINLNDLAREMATNRNKLSKAFKAHFGLSIFSWLREQRMLRAEELLRLSNLSIHEVSHSVSYLDSNNFSTAFKRAFRLSPREYRKMHHVKKTVQETKVVLG